MSWSLTASGHSDNPQDEQKLAAALGQTLADAGQAVSSAQFYGGAVQGDPRDLVPLSPAAETETGDGSQAGTPAADTTTG